jgi:ribonuclease HI
MLEGQQPQPPTTKSSNLTQLPADNKAQQSPAPGHQLQPQPQNTMQRHEEATSPTGHPSPNSKTAQTTTALPTSRQMTTQPSEPKPHGELQAELPKIEQPLKHFDSSIKDTKAELKFNEDKNNDVISQKSDDTDAILLQLIRAERKVLEIQQAIDADKAKAQPKNNEHPSSISNIGWKALNMIKDTAVKTYNFINTFHDSHEATRKEASTPNRSRLSSMEFKTVLNSTQEKNSYFKGSKRSMSYTKLLNVNKPLPKNFVVIAQPSPFKIKCNSDDETEVKDPQVNHKQPEKPTKQPTTTETSAPAKQNVVQVQGPSTVTQSPGTVQGQSPAIAHNWNTPESKALLAKANALAQTQQPELQNNQPNLQLNQTSIQPPSQKPYQPANQSNQQANQPNNVVSPFGHAIANAKAKTPQAPAPTTYPLASGLGVKIPNYNQGGYSKITPPEPQSTNKPTTTSNWFKETGGKYPESEDYKRKMKERKIRNYQEYEKKTEKYEAACIARKEAQAAKFKKQIIPNLKYDQAEVDKTTKQILEVADYKAKHAEKTKEPFDKAENYKVKYYSSMAILPPEKPKKQKEESIIPETFIRQYAIMTEDTPFTVNLKRFRHLHPDEIMFQEDFDDALSVLTQMHSTKNLLSIITDNTWIGKSLHHPVRKADYSKDPTITYPGKRTNLEGVQWNEYYEIKYRKKPKKEDVPTYTEYAIYKNGFYDAYFDAVRRTVTKASWLNTNSHGLIDQGIRMLENFYSNDLPKGYYPASLCKISAILNDRDWAIFTSQIRARKMVNKEVNWQNVDKYLDKQQRAEAAQIRNIKKRKRELIQKISFGGGLSELEKEEFLKYDGIEAEPLSEADKRMQAQQERIKLNKEYQYHLNTAIQLHEENTLHYEKTGQILHECQLKRIQLAVMSIEAMGREILLNTENMSQLKKIQQKLPHIFIPPKEDEDEPKHIPYIGEEPNFAFERDHQGELVLPKPLEDIIAAFTKLPIGQDPEQVIETTAETKAKKPNRRKNKFELLSREGTEANIILNTQTQRVIAGNRQANTNHEMHTMRPTGRQADQPPAPQVNTNPERHQPEQQTAQPPKVTSAQFTNIIIPPCVYIVACEEQTYIRRPEPQPVNVSVEIPEPQEIFHVKKENPAELFCKLMKKKTDDKVAKKGDRSSSKLAYKRRRSDTPESRNSERRKKDKKSSKNEKSRSREAQDREDTEYIQTVVGTHFRENHTNPSKVNWKYSPKPLPEGSTWQPRAEPTPEQLNTTVETKTPESNEQLSPKVKTPEPEKKEQTPVLKPLELTSHEPKHKAKLPEEPEQPKPIVKQPEVTPVQPRAESLVKKGTLEVYFQNVINNMFEQLLSQPQDDPKARREDLEALTETMVDGDIIVKDNVAKGILEYLRIDMQNDYREYEKLFKLCKETDLNNTKFDMYFDGAAGGKPELAGAGILFRIGKKTVANFAIRLKDDATNNLAEYSGVLFGILIARMAGIKLLHANGDSLVIVNQLKGTYKVREEKLVTHFNICWNLIRGFEGWQITHYMRELNKEADKLSKDACKKSLKLNKADEARRQKRRDIAWKACKGKEEKIESLKAILIKEQTLKADLRMAKKAKIAAEHYSDTQLFKDAKKSEESFEREIAILEEEVRGKANKYERYLARTQIQEKTVLKTLGTGNEEIPISTAEAFDKDTPETFQLTIDMMLKARVKDDEEQKKVDEEEADILAQELEEMKFALDKIEEYDELSEIDEEDELDARKIRAEAKMGKPVRRLDQPKVDLYSNPVYKRMTHNLMFVDGTPNDNTMAEIVRFNPKLVIIKRVTEIPPKLLNFDCRIIARHEHYMTLMLTNLKIGFKASCSTPSPSPCDLTIRTITTRKELIFILHRGEKLGPKEWKLIKESKKKIWLVKDEPTAMRTPEGFVQVAEGIYAREEVTRLENKYIHTNDVQVFSQFSDSGIAFKKTTFRKKFLVLSTQKWDANKIKTLFEEAKKEKVHFGEPYEKPSKELATIESEHGLDTKGVRINQLDKMNQMHQNEISRELWNIFAGSCGKVSKHKGHKLRSFDKTVKSKDGKTSTVETYFEDECNQKAAEFYFEDNHKRFGCNQRGKQQYFPKFNEVEKDFLIHRIDRTLSQMKEHTCTGILGLKPEDYRIYCDEHRQMNQQYDAKKCERCQFKFNFISFLLDHMNEYGELLLHTYLISNEKKENIADSVRCLFAMDPLIRGIDEYLNWSLQALNIETGDYQKAFKAGVYQHLVLDMRDLVEKKEKVVAMIDLEKAYDSVPWELRKKIEDKLDKKIVQLWKFLDYGFHTMTKGKKNHLKGSLIQGRASSTAIFNIFTTLILIEEGVSRERILAFADDWLLYGDTIEEVQDLLAKVKVALAKYGIKVNTDKTVWLEKGKIPKEEFTYMGVHFKGNLELKHHYKVIRKHCRKVLEALDSLGLDPAYRYKIYQTNIKCHYDLIQKHALRTERKPENLLEQREFIVRRTQECNRIHHIETDKVNSHTVRLSDPKKQADFGLTLSEFKDLQDLYYPALTKGRRQIQSQILKAITSYGDRKMPFQYTEAKKEDMKEALPPKIPEDHEGRFMKVKVQVTSCAIKEVRVKVPTPEQENAILGKKSYDELIKDDHLANSLESIQSMETTLTREKEESDNGKIIILNHCVNKADQIPKIMGGTESNNLCSEINTDQVKLILEQLRAGSNHDDSASVLGFKCCRNADSNALINNDNNPEIKSKNNPADNPAENQLEFPREAENAIRIVSIFQKPVSEYHEFTERQIEEELGIVPTRSAKPKKITKITQWLTKKIAEEREVEKIHFKDLATKWQEEHPEETEILKQIPIEEKIRIIQETADAYLKLKNLRRGQERAALKRKKKDAIEAQENKMIVKATELGLIRKWDTEERKASKNRPDEDAFLKRIYDLGKDSKTEIFDVMGWTEAPASTEVSRTKVSRPVLDDILDKKHMKEVEDLMIIKKGDSELLGKRTLFEPSMSKKRLTNSQKPKKPKVSHPKNKFMDVEDIELMENSLARAENTETREGATVLPHGSTHQTPMVENQTPMGKPKSLIVPEVNPMSSFAATTPSPAVGASTTCSSSLS